MDTGPDRAKQDRAGDGGDMMVIESEKGSDSKPTACDASLEVRFVAGLVQPVHCAYLLELWLWRSIDAVDQKTNLAVGGRPKIHCS